MTPLYLAVNTGGLTAPFTLQRPDQRQAVAVPSLGNAAQITAEFTATSGTGPFYPLCKTDGSGLPFIVHSGPGPAVCMLPHLPSAYGQLRLNSGPTVVATFTLLTLTARW